MATESQRLTVKLQELPEKQALEINENDIMLIEDEKETSKVSISSLIAFILSKITNVVTETLNESTIKINELDSSVKELSESLKDVTEIVNQITANNNNTDNSLIEDSE